MKEQIQALRAEADRLEQKATLLAAYDTLRSISSEEFQMRQSLNCPKWSSLTELSFAVTHVRRDIAARLGHTERVDLLVLAGMERERADSGDLITNEAAAECFATWLFDRFGQFEDIPEWSSSVDVDREQFPLGYQFWEEGRHDT